MPIQCQSSVEEHVIPPIRSVQICHLVHVFPSGVCQSRPDSRASSKVRGSLQLCHHNDNCTPKCEYIHWLPLLSLYLIFIYTESLTTLQHTLKNLHCECPSLCVCVCVCVRVRVRARACVRVCMRVVSRSPPLPPSSLSPPLSHVGPVQITQRAVQIRSLFNTTSMTWT